MRDRWICSTVVTGRKAAQDGETHVGRRDVDVRNEGRRRRDQRQNRLQLDIPLLRLTTIRSPFIHPWTCAIVQGSANYPD